jgi:uncharacterized protein YkwD
MSGRSTPRRSASRHGRPDPQQQYSPQEQPYPDARSQQPELQYESPDQYRARREHQQQHSGRHHATSPFDDFQYQQPDYQSDYQPDYPAMDYQGSGAHDRGIPQPRHDESARHGGVGRRGARHGAAPYAGEYEDGHPPAVRDEWQPAAHPPEPVGYASPRYGQQPAHTTTYEMRALERPPRQVEAYPEFERHSRPNHQGPDEGFDDGYLPEEGDGDGERPGHRAGSNQGGSARRRRQNGPRRGRIVVIALVLGVVVLGGGYLMSNGSHHPSSPTNPDAAGASGAPSGVPSAGVSAAPSTAPSASVSGSATPSGSATQSTESPTDQVLDLINKARKQAGLSPYRLSTKLDKSAEAHNKVMSAGCGLSHQCPGEAAIGTRESDVGVDWSEAGENIGEGGPIADTSAAEAQMAVNLTQQMIDEQPPNDGHRQNILSNGYTYVGISVYRDSNGTLWLTQDFANAG